MRFRRSDPFLNDDPTLNACFDFVFMIALFGLLPAIGMPLWHRSPFQTLSSKPWSATELIPAYGHSLALIWLWFADRWAKSQKKRLEEVPKLSVERVYRHAELEAQRRGVSWVLWGVVAGSSIVIVVGWTLPKLLDS